MSSSLYTSYFSTRELLDFPLILACVFSATSDLVDEGFCFGFLIDVGAQLNQTLGQRRVSVLAGLFQHAVVKLRVAPHLRQSQAHRLTQLTADRKREQRKLKEVNMSLYKFVY